MPRLLKLITDFRRMGDINGDGVIDDNDVHLFMKAFPSKRGDPNYNPDCDFNGNGEVDKNDLTVLFQNYGLTKEKWKAEQTKNVLTVSAFIILTLVLGGFFIIK